MLSKDEIKKRINNIFKTRGLEQYRIGGYSEGEYIEIKKESWSVIKFHFELKLKIQEDNLVVHFHKGEIDKNKPHIREVAVKTFGEPIRDTTIYAFKTVPLDFSTNENIDETMNAVISNINSDDFQKWVKIADDLVEEIKLLEKNIGYKDINIEELENMNGNKEYEKNTILYGPPGTGKTYNTAIRAVAICNPELSLDSLEKEDYSKVINKYDVLKEIGQIAFTTFHQSYGYEEFIEGIQPVLKSESRINTADQENNNLEYRIKPGVFKEFCDKARKNKDKNYVFIIDEINRGNISIIFGELITLIEDSKREGQLEEVSAILPYSQEPFSVPNNVYILGTMNTADRSIALMDTALRRRFDFVEMMPDSSKIKVTEVAGIEIKEMLDKINQRIEFLYDREHTIGHAFFMKLNNESSISDLEDIFKNKIIPLLQEYFYEDYEKIRLVLGDDFKSNPFIKVEEINPDKLFFLKKNSSRLEKTSIYSINENAFEDPRSYIGIYEKTKSHSDESDTDSEVVDNNN